MTKTRVCVKYFTWLIVGYLTRKQNHNGQDLKWYA